MRKSDDEKFKMQMLVTEHERLLDQFGEMIQDQQNQIDRLKQKLQLLELKLADNDEPGPDPLADEPPPHY